MECFQILALSINATEKEIKRAYAKLLPDNSPELNPEGFQKLRKAFEEALAYLKNKELATDDGSVTDQKNDEIEINTEDPQSVKSFCKEFGALYSDYKKRIDSKFINEWFNKQQYYNLETGDLIRERILAYLMDHYFMPQGTWSVIAGYFGVKSSRDVLVRQFPVDFIDYVIRQSEEVNAFEFAELIPVADRANAFLSAHSDALMTIGREDNHPFLAAMVTLEDILPDQTNLLILKARNHTYHEAYEEALLIYETLSKRQLNNLDYFFFYGENYFKMGKFDLAIPLFEKALNIKPHSMWTRYYLGMSICEQGNLEEGFIYLNDVTSYGLNDPKALKAISEIVDKIILVKEQHVNQSQYRTKAKQGDMILELVMLYYRQGRESEAVNLFNDLDENLFTSEAYYSFKASLKMSQGMIDEALKAVNRGLIYEPFSTALLYKKASFLHDTNQFEDAIIIYDQLIESGYEDPTALNNKAHALNQLGRYDEAVKCCHLLLSKYWRFEYAYKNRGIAYLGLGNYEKAFQDSIRALEINPRLAEAYLTQLKVYNTLEYYEDLIKVGEGYIENKLEETEEFFRLMAGGYTKLGNYHKVVEMAKKCINMNPEEAFYYIKCADAYDEIGIPTESIKLLEKALVIDPDNLTALIDLSYYYVNNGLFDKAVELCDRVIVNQPTNELAYRNKGWALVNLKAFNQLRTNIDEAVYHCGLSDELMKLKFALVKNTQSIDIQHAFIINWIDQYPESKAAQQALDALAAPVQAAAMQATGIDKSGRIILHKDKKHWLRRFFPWAIGLVIIIRLIMIWIA